MKVNVFINTFRQKQRRVTAKRTLLKDFLKTEALNSGCSLTSHEIFTKY